MRMPLPQVINRLISRNMLVTTLIVVLIVKVLSIKMLHRPLPLQTGVQDLSSLHTHAPMPLVPLPLSIRRPPTPGAPAIVPTVSKVLPRHLQAAQSLRRLLEVYEVTAVPHRAQAPSLAIRLGPINVLAPPHRMHRPPYLDHQ